MMTKSNLRYSLDQLKIFMKKYDDRILNITDKQVVFQGKETCLMVTWNGTAKYLNKNTQKYFTFKFSIAMAEKLM
jgi:hypothetical protein